MQVGLAHFTWISNRRTRLDAPVSRRARPENCFMRAILSEVGGWSELKLAPVNLC
jgi:hypothetical protein